MDEQLLIALAVLWISTTSALVVFFRMWFAYNGEAFHPHSTDVELRHNLFLVVNSKTVCKHDFVVKSISSFVAPRGSSSSKIFTVLIVIVAIAGALGACRWYYVGDATFLEASLAFIGFNSLLCVTGFELDVVPERFLEDKLIVTGWLIEKLNMAKDLPFNLHYSDERFLEFIRQSNEIYHLYEEDLYIQKRISSWTYDFLWPTMHMLGACTYVILVPTAIILNDINEEKVAWITGSLFGTFCFLAYLTGNYVPVIKYFRGWILLWNPFYKEPHFMLKLKNSIENYKTNLILQKNSPTKSSTNKRKKFKSKSNNNLKLNENSKFYLEEAEKADQALDSIFLRFARRNPKLYLKILGQLLVISELVAILTPSVAMGIQWVTALCDDAPILSIIELMSLLFNCIKSGNCSTDKIGGFKHCILN